LKRGALHRIKGQDQIGPGNRRREQLMAIAETSLTTRTALWSGGLRPRSTEAVVLDGPADPGSSIDRWRRRIRLRHHLARLLRVDAGLIEDVGLSVQEAEKEIAKPFWRL
jgi:uncharacterized protein YjiS (DUF1127 family)